MILAPLDLAAVAVYLGIIIFAGILSRKYIRGIRDFLVADRAMGLHLGLASLLSSEIGIITFMYLAEAGYRNGLVALGFGLPFLLVFLFLGRTGFIIKPLLEMKIMTVPELFHKTFGPGVRLTAGLLMAVGGVINFGVFPRVEAKFINAVTGIPQQELLGTMIALLAVVLIVTALGGMVSVILTNYLQYILLSLGMIFLTVFCFLKIGWGRIVQAVSAAYGSRGVNPLAAGSEFGPTFLLWQVFFQLAVLTVAPYIAMRIFSAKDSQTGKLIFGWSSVLFLARAVLPVFWGVMAFAYFAGREPGEPLLALPRMIAALTPRGLLGLLLASFLAASMSTYSSYLLSFSALISRDVFGLVWERATGRPLSGRAQIIMNRLTMAGIIGFLIWWSFFFSSEELLLFYLLMAVNLFLAGTLVSAVFGIYLRGEQWGRFRARPAGAFLAFIFGALPTVWFFLPGHPPVSTLGVLSFAFALAGMLLGSTAHNFIRPEPSKAEGS